MSLIRRVEIRYFRSIYRVALSLRDLNILSGKNDAGKSNVLKALNLFFSGDTDWGLPLAFSRDFCARRLEEVRRETVKGKQFISVSLEFNRPKNYEGSLPPVFTVRRKWLRTGERVDTNDLETEASKRALPSTLETAKRFLAFFLNRVHFEYVPAVKDRAYFDHLLGRLQSTLLKTPLDPESLIGRTAENLAKHVQAQVVSLQADFQRATGLATKIEPPTELAALFQSFAVSTGKETGGVPLTSRGDGIQARYVPSVLNYIAKASNDFFVWGFEEPENSLELSYSADLAKDFAEIYSRDAQVLLTTHSPPILSLKAPHIVCFRVYRQNDSTEVVNATEPEQASKLREELGILNLQQELHLEYKLRLAELQQQTATLGQIEEEMRQRDKPIVLTEGQYDVEILTHAWSSLFPGQECPFLIRAADTLAGATEGGAGGAQSLVTMLSGIHPDEGRRVLGIFDRDEEGVRAYSRLSNNFVEERPCYLKRHKNRLAMALLLPTPEGREPYRDASNLSIERYFSEEVLARRTPAGRGLVIEEQQVTAVMLGPRRIDAGQLRIPDLSVPPGYAVIRGGKDSFAREIVPSLSPDDFNAFAPLFAEIQALVVAE